jgi:hypothetical protein
MKMFKTIAHQNRREVSMKARLKRNVILILTVTVILGINGYAFAGWGMGNRHMNQESGSGWGTHHDANQVPGHGCSGSLSEEELAIMEKHRRVFLKNTEPLRQHRYTKKFELTREMSKENPDIKKALRLQDDISKLDSRLNRKGIEYELKMRKISTGYRNGHRGAGYRGKSLVISKDHFGRSSCD